MSLIVADEEFSRGASRIRDMSDELLDIFALYSKIIDELTNKGICSNSVQNVLAEKVTTLSGYSNLLSGITSRIVNETTDFIADIDEADSYLYD
jgi:hypothetical protein